MCVRKYKPIYVYTYFTSANACIGTPFDVLIEAVSSAQRTRDDIHFKLCTIPSHGDVHDPTRVREMSIDKTKPSGTTTLYPQILFTY